MPIHQRVSLLFAMLALLVPGGHACAQGNAELSGRDFFLHAGVGASNGARLGFSYRFSPHFEVEGSLGYVRVLNYFTYPERASESVGMTPSLGINYVTSSNHSNFGIASLLLSYQVGTKKIIFQHERRLAITAAIGSEFLIAGPLSAQLRLGPTLHVVLAPVRGATQLLMQYDGCIGWRF
jgi:hypothetical protein